MSYYNNDRPPGSTFQCLMGSTPTVQIPWGWIHERDCLKCYDGQLHNAQEFWSDVG